MLLLGALLGRRRLGGRLLGLGRGPACARVVKLRFASRECRAVSDFLSWERNARARRMGEPSQRAAALVFRDARRSTPRVRNDLGRDAGAVLGGTLLGFGRLGLRRLLRRLLGHGLIASAGSKVPRRCARCETELPILARWELYSGIKALATAPFWVQAKTERSYACSYRHRR